MSRFAFFDPRRRSLLRGNLLVLVSFAAAVRISNFPLSHATPLLAVPAIFTLLGIFETVRCMQRRWNFYHGGVVLCIYMDLMALSMILFLLFCPYLL